MSEPMKIYCYAKTAGHRSKGVLADAFIPPLRPGEHWTRSITSAWLREKMTAPGQVTPDNAFTVDEGDGSRFVWVIACPVCSPGRTPLTAEWETVDKGAIPLRPETLDQILDQARHAGMSTIPLDALRSATMRLGR